MPTATPDAFSIRSRPLSESERAAGALRRAALPAPPEPTLAERAALLARALDGWRAQGYPLAEDAVLNARRALCDACPQWSPPAPRNAWLGACRRCGCSGLKLRLATERCPLGEW